MTFFGETIRKAREAKGLTLSEVAQKTHILVQTLADMERENFKRIPAAIYGRGFVRHICECLEIDPKPLVAEFMDIYQGRKKPMSAAPFQPKKPLTPSPLAAEPAPAIVEPTPAIAEPAPSIIEPVAPTAVVEPHPEMAEPVAASPEPQPISEPAPEATPTELKGLDLFDPPPTAADAPAKPAPSIFDAPMASPAEPPPVTRAQDIFSTSYAAPKIDDGPSAAEKFRESLSVVSHGVLGGVRRIPRSAWRIAILAVGALFVLVLLIWGCTVLYRITEKPASPTIPEAQPTAPAAAATATSAKGSPATAPKSQAAAAATKKTGQATTPGQNVKLRSTGEKVPPLYVD